jgi:PBP1b-binding outer membrane lipoprotein LpoB
MKKKTLIILLTLGLLVVSCKRGLEEMAKIDAPFEEQKIDTTSVDTTSVDTISVK